MNNKRLHWIFMVCTACFLAGCSGLRIDDTAGPLPPPSTAAPSPAPTYTPIPLDSQLPTRTPVPDTPTPEPTNTPTTSPTPTLAPQVVWNNSIVAVGNIDAYDGNWSPKAYEYLWIDSLEPTDSTSIPKYAAAPDFQPIILATLQSDFWGSLIWGLDGENIFCLGCMSSELPHPTVLIFDNDGSNPRAVCQVTNDYLEFVGWLDPQNIVIEKYAGGGHVEIQICNTETGEIAPWGGIVHGGADRPNNGYIPARSDNGSADPRLLVTSKRFPYNDEVPASTRASGNFAWLPDYAGVSYENAFSMFEDWRPNTNQILAYWISFSGSVFSDMGPQKQNSHLLLWDVETNNLRLAAPNAKGGRFSPDGAWLAYLTDGPASLDTAYSPISGEKNPDPTLPDYMQLLEMANGKVWFSLPVLSIMDNDDIIFETHARLNAEFSPDNRFLAFLTPGEIQVEEDFDLTIAPEAIDPSNVRLNLVDLQARTLVQAFSVSKTPSIGWSPDGSYLAFQDQAENWQILDLEGLAIFPLTTLNGEYVDHIQWSYDGHYLSARACIPLDSFDHDCQIQIFDFTSILNR